MYCSNLSIQDARLFHHKLNNITVALKQGQEELRDILSMHNEATLTRDENMVRCTINNRII
jgi:hypothetical protein